jgi:hypothetical protein
VAYEKCETYLNFYAPFTVLPISATGISKVLMDILHQKWILMSVTVIVVQFKREH